ncbi:helix-turn-helix domain-containing protein [Clostridium sp. HCP1S3_B4]|uniref:helix-turn-helix domain-containing protein n=1 Tax=unclassified Clostridium TaxID=2614128 RepID=UPI003F8BD7E9
MSDNLVGKRIKYLRELNNLSQEEFAMKSGITRAYLGQIERGEKNPTITIVSKICNALGITLEDFFSSDDNKDIYTKKIINLVNNMSSNEKEWIYTIIESTLKFKEEK